jgi:hypothetical protein
VRDRPKASQFPGEAMAASLTRAWHERYGMPLRYVAGSEFYANNLAIYSPDRPRVVVHGDLKLSPWIATEDLRRHGAIIVWQEELAEINRWRKTFGAFTAEPALLLPRHTWTPVRSARILFAFVPPQP